jgi:hypothetical protein
MAMEIPTMKIVLSASVFPKTISQPLVLSRTSMLSLLSVCEELEGTVSKGDTLKEREMIDKAGLNHPGESTVIYALKHTIPNFLSHGSANPRQTALKAVKTAADRDQGNW